MKYSHYLKEIDHSLVLSHLIISRLIVETAFDGGEPSCGIPFPMCYDQCKEVIFCGNKMSCTEMICECN